MTVIPSISNGSVMRQEIILKPEDQLKQLLEQHSTSRTSVVAPNIGITQIPLNVTPIRNETVRLPAYLPIPIKNEFMDIEEKNLLPTSITSNGKDQHFASTRNRTNPFITYQIYSQMLTIWVCTNI